MQTSKIDFGFREGTEMTTNQEWLRYEDAIVWTEDVSQVDYVRARLDHFTSSRQRPIRWRGPGRLVGYTTLSPNAPAGEAPGRFARRVFWIDPGDRSEKPNGIYRVGAPAEAIDPRTIAIGIWGELTDRAEGAELPPTKGDDSLPADPARPAGGKNPVVPGRDGSLWIGSSLATGRATVFVAPDQQGLVEVFIDCASGSKLGDGSQVIAETLPYPEAAELLARIVTTTPWLQRAIALSVVERWLTNGTAEVGEVDQS